MNFHNFDRNSFCVMNPRERMCDPYRESLSCAHTHAFNVTTGMGHYFHEFAGFFQRSRAEESTKKIPLKQNPPLQNGLVQAVNERTLALVDFKANKTDLENLDQQVKSMMKHSDNADPYGQGKARVCKVCGKEGSTMNIMNHIEANHITGISLTCSLCGKFFTSRNTLNSHKSKYHRNK